MSDHSMPPWDDEMLQLLEAEKKIPNYSNDLRDEVASRLSMSVDALGWSEGAASAPAHQVPIDATTSASWLSSAWVKVALTTAVVLPTGFYLGRAVGERAAVPAPAFVQERVVKEEQPTPARAADPAPVPPPVPERQPDKPKTAFKTSGDGRLAEERALLELARTAIMSNRLEDAAKALKQHDSEFKFGRLQEERESLKIQLLLVSGKTEEAKRLIEVFAQKYPESMLLPALKEAVISR